MKIHLVSPHQYPARLGAAAAARVGDWLAKGLVELGEAYETFGLVTGDLA